MKKIDELILKILLLKPLRLHEHGDTRYYLFFKDITLCFVNMDTYTSSADLGLVRINSNDVERISSKTKTEVLKYFKKTEKIDNLLIRINQDIRKEKLLSINKNN